MSPISDTISNNPLNGIDLQTIRYARITMTRFHRGVPLCEEVKIIAIQGETLILKAQNSLALVDTQGIIHLLSPEFPKPVRGVMLHRDLWKGTFVLGELEYIAEGWQERKQIRVQPEFPVFFTIQKMGRNIRADLLDLDVTGLGASVDRGDMDYLKLQADFNIHLNLQLRPDLELTALRGTIRYTRNISKHLIRLGISMHPNPRQADLLSHYVNRRRDEIMQDLTLTYQQSFSPTPVESLYF